MYTNTPKVCQQQRERKCDGSKGKQSGYQVGIENFSIVEAVKADRSFAATAAADGADAAADDPICEPMDEESEGAAADTRCGQRFKPFHTRNLLQMLRVLLQHARAARTWASCWRMRGRPKEITRAGGACGKGIAAAAAWEAAAEEEAAARRKSLRL